MIDRDESFADWFGILRCSPHSRRPALPEPQSKSPEPLPVKHEPTKQITMSKICRPSQREQYLRAGAARRLS